MNKEKQYMPILGSVRSRLKDGPDKFPMELLNEEHAQAIHGQSLSRLAERGGMGYDEIICNVKKLPYSELQKLDEKVCMISCSNRIKHFEISQQPSPLPESVEEAKWQLCPKCNGSGEMYINELYKNQTTGIVGYITCDVCGGAKILASPSSSSAEVERLRTQNEQCIEIFKWLLGHYDFPEPPKEGRPHYYWRSHLQDKLKKSGIEIKNIESPFQKRETDI